MFHVEKCRQKLNHDGSQSAGSPSPPKVASTHAMDSSNRIMRVTKYDRVAGLLVALLIIVGAVVSMMAIVWLSGRVHVRKPAVAAHWIEPLSRGGSSLGTMPEWVEPGADEVEDFLEPQIEETVMAITDQLSSRSAALDTLDSVSESPPSGAGAGGSPWIGEGGEADIVPRWQRWRLHFDASSLRAYAKQLDYFRIELGVVGKSEAIDYASKLSMRVPVRRTGRPADDRRLYMTWEYGPLKAADLKLLQRAGIDTQGRVVMQFYPADVEEQIAQVEFQHTVASGHVIEDVRRTTFIVVGDGRKYRFDVESQQLR